MRKQRIFCKTLIGMIVAFVLMLGTIAIGVTQNDPVLSLSYINNTVKPAIMAQIEQKVIQKMTGTPKITETGERVVSQISGDNVISEAADRVLEQLQLQNKYLFTTNGRKTITLSKGDTITGLAGTTFLMRSGSATVVTRPIINISHGVEVKAGSTVAQNTNYMISADDGSGVRIASPSATIAMDGTYRIISSRYHAKYFDLADALKKMNLFRGSNVGYELDRGATRTEAVVMLLRLLGKENDALTSSVRHPFDDVDAWANGYLGYAFDKGYAHGVSNTHFGSKDMTTANHYMTFLLRALGYNDKKGDFQWDHALEKACALKIITQGEKSAIQKAGFQRDQMVYLSYYSLFAKMRGTDKTLLSYLIESGVVQKSDAEAATKSISQPRL